MHLRRLVWAIVVCCLLAPGTASAESREVKKIKKALVRIERSIDDARNELVSAKQRQRELRTLIPETRQALKVHALYAVSGVFPPDLRFLDDFVVINEGEAELARMQTSVPKQRDRLLELVLERDAKTRELLGYVVQAQARRGVGAMTLNGNIVTYSADWQKVSMCESSGRWHVDSQFDGGLQFHPITWVQFGGGEFSRYAFEASKVQQIAIAERVLAIQGPKAWPNCYHPLPFGF
jgi:Transglycosylase-like domain